MYFYIIKSGGTIILTKRGTGGIWSSLYHFPMLESDQEHPKEEIADKLTTMVLSQLTSGVHESGGGLGGAALIHLEKISEPIRHQLSHLTIHARFIHLELTPLPLSLPAQYLYISLENLPEFPVPRLMERYMEVAKF